MDGTRLVARNVRRFRLDRGLSIGEIARRSGLSKQTLSKLEQGQGNPTIETLAALGAALDVSLRRLLTEWGSPVLVRRSQEGEWAERPGGQELLLDEVYGSGYVRTWVQRLSRGDDSGELEGLAPGALHHVYVVSGRVRLGPLSDSVEVSAGDFVRFPGDTPHRQTCVSERALLHVVTTFPQIRQLGPTRVSEPQSG